MSSLEVYCPKCGARGAEFVSAPRNRDGSYCMRCCHAAVPEPKSTRRKKGIVKIVTGLSGAFLVIGLALYALPSLQATLNLVGAAAVILQFGYAITGVYEVCTGRPWQRLEDKWNALTPGGRGLWGTIIVTTACLIIGATLWLLAPILRKLDPPSAPPSRQQTR